MKSWLLFIAGLVIGPVLVALAAIAGILPSDAISNPPKWETSLGMRALDASLDRRADGLKNPIAANDLAALAAGRKLYAMNCAGCHGSASGPSDWGAKAFYPRAPQFWQQGSDVTAAEAYAAIHDGVRYSGMGAWRDLMKLDDTWKVANFVASLHERSKKTAPSQP